MQCDWILHDSHDLFFRNPFGALPCGERVRVRIKMACPLPLYSVILQLRDHEDKEKKVTMYLKEENIEYKIYEAILEMPRKPGVLWYYFEINWEHGQYLYGNNEKGLGGQGSTYLKDPKSYQITVYEGNSTTPNWFKESVMYQIFPDRFYNGHPQGKVLGSRANCFIYGSWEDRPMYIKDGESGKIGRWEFFGGNLLGIIQKLPYLQGLGVGVIYLNPIFQAQSNHRYDTGDYHQIDPMLGSNEDFQRLCQEAKKLGMAVILDGVFSHTGSDSIYFNQEGTYPGVGAYQSRDSVYTSWYRFKNFPNEYDCWWGFENMPNVNEWEPSYENFIIHGEKSVMNHWVGLGAKGWRLDVVDELPGHFIKSLRKKMKEIDLESILIGEIWEDASNKYSHGEKREYLLGNELDSAMNYPLRKLLLDFFLGKLGGPDLLHGLMSLYENYPKHHFYSMMNLIGSHDTPRVLTLLGEAPGGEELTQGERQSYYLPKEQRQLGVARLKLASLFQMTFPGVPAIYYGDEAGLEGHDDPLNRGTYPWGREDEELLGWYQKMISLRNQYHVLKTGDWAPIPSPKDVVAYSRQIKGGKDTFGQERKDQLAIVLLNRSKEKEQMLTIELKKYGLKEGMQGKNPITQEAVETLLEDAKIKLQPLEGKLLVFE